MAISVQPPDLHYAVYPDKLKVMLCKPYGYLSPGYA
jgi:hypothetical protein